MLNILEHYTPVQENSFMVTEDDKQFLRITETNKCELVFNLKEKGLWWKKGLVNFCKINVDLSEWRYLIFEIYNPGEELLELEIRLHTLNLVTNQQRDNYNEKGIEEVLKKTVSIIGKGWHKLSIPIEEFNHYRCFKRVHRFVERISFEIKNSGVKGEVLLKDLYLANGRDIVISCELLSRAGKIGEIIEYEVKIKNISSITKVIWIEQEKYGWEVMETEIKPDKVILKPDEQVNVKINVKISDRVPEGGIEKQKVKIYYTSASNNLEFETIEFITVCTLKNPYLIHTVEGWQRVREKIEKYEWAKKEAKKIIERAENWMPPEKRDSSYLFYSYTDEEEMVNCAYAYQLTLEKRFAEKVAKMLKIFGDPNIGYPATYQVCNCSMVQEGHFFKHLALAYDLIYNAEVLNEEDHKNIQNAFRLYLNMLDKAIRGISNWEIFELAGAVFSSLVIKDFYWLERFLFGPFGVEEQISKGILDDGWWFECSIGYNIAAARELTLIANACDKWGYDIGHRKYSPNYKECVVPEMNYSLERIAVKLDTGPKSNRNFRCIKDLWDSLLMVSDYRGVIFGFNDATEHRLDGKVFDLAYFYYRDPRYAEMIKKSNERDVIFGVEELSTESYEFYKKSFYTSHSGVVVLRAQDKNREMKDRIQAVLKFGVHGGAHGHFDRCSLVSLMRYGRSFYNPEVIWYSYPSFMYRFYVQSSINHNMVVVDLKQQMPQHGKISQFYSGNKMQVACVEVETQWAYPQYGGLKYNPKQTFEEKCWEEGRYVPIPSSHPKYAEMSGFTEPVFQRRLAILTDDYLLTLDYLKGANNHIFDCLFHLENVRFVEAEQKYLIEHTEQLTTDPLTSAQFITDCNWFKIKLPAWLSSNMIFTGDNEKDRTKYNDPGNLNIDIHPLWPQDFIAWIGTAPEAQNVQKRVWYKIIGDGKLLKEGKLGTWVLGRDDIELDIAGIKTLEMRVKAEPAFLVLKSKDILKTIFWADPVIVASDGKIVDLCREDIPKKFINCEINEDTSKDYYGGSIIIQGKRFTKGLGGEPIDYNQESVIRVDISKLEGKILKLSIGGVFPVGKEKKARKVVGIRSEGEEALFVNLMEVYESQKMVKYCTVDENGVIHVMLNDGREHQIMYRNLNKKEAKPEVEFIEIKGFDIMKESTNNDI